MRLRETSPPLCRLGVFKLAFWGRWHPKQLGFQELWQAMQFMFLLLWAHCSAELVWPQVI